MTKNITSKAFLIVLLLAILYACYLLFKPFLVEILAAAILVTIFYTPYEWLVKKMWNRRALAATVMILLIFVVVIAPFANLTIYGAQKSVGAYKETVKYVSENNVEILLKDGLSDKLQWLGLDANVVKQVILDSANSIRKWFADGATKIAFGTLDFLLSILWVVLALFLFFIEGKNILKKIMEWTPLSNKYDKEIFSKFKDVSKSIVLSTFVTALAQGIVGALAFIIVGLPAFFAGIIMSFLSLLPWFGAALVWLPTGIYLLATGRIWQGIFILAWGVLVVSNIDNLLRAYLIKGKAKVHPILLIFAIIGGISMFGFWGIFFGPLIVSLAVTILHIYELEYKDVLER